MGELAVPSVVTHRLRVLASHERLRQMVRASVSARMRHMADSVSLFMDNMMRPVALPFGGGLLSAVLLFGILAPGLSFFPQRGVSILRSPRWSLCRRASWSTRAPGETVGAAGEVVSVEMAGFVSVEGVGSIPSSTDSTLVELTVDRYGYILDWRMVQGELTPEVKSVIVSSSFDPGTYFGVPTDSKVLVALHSVHGAARS